MNNYFSDEELNCKCDICDGSKHNMQPMFLNRLNELRHEYGKPIYLNSAYRCHSHNAYVGGVPNSPHTQGLAVDIKVSGQDAHRITKLAFKYGFTGIGVRQTGKHANRFIHIDLLSIGKLRPRIWSY